MPKFGPLQVPSPALTERTADCKTDDMTELDGSPVSVDDLLALGLAPFGHFTSIRVEDRRAKGIGLHLERLARDCQAVFGVQLDTEKAHMFSGGTFQDNAACH